MVTVNVIAVGIINFYSMLTSVAVPFLTIAQNDLSIV
jgi:hypothetical protein